MSAGGKDEEKILELLRKRVLEKDKELAQKEYLNATKEALVQMTTLTEEEVDEIYRQIEREIEFKKNKKRIVIFFSIVFLIFFIYHFSGALLNLFNWSSSEKKEQKKENKKWSIINEDSSGFYIEDGKFIMDSRMDRGVHLISKDFEFPNYDFSIEFEVFRILGRNENFFGIYLNEGQYDYEYYLINCDGEYKVGKENKIRSLSYNRIERNEFGDWKNGKTIKYNSKNFKVNTFKIKIKRSSFEILVNNLKVCSFHSDSHENISFKNFSLVLENNFSSKGESQKIAIDNLTIKDLKNNNILYRNTFDNEW